jgi:ABC-2 type transport system permease protein
VLAITEAELRRFLADRSNIFFVFVFPLVLVAVLGASFGGGAGPSARVALVGGESALRSAVVAQLEDAGAEVTLTQDEEMRQRVARGGADVGVLVSPAAAQAFAAGEGPQLEMVTGSQSNAQAAAQVVRTAAGAATLRAGQQRAVAAAVAAAGVPGGDVGAALDGAATRIPATQTQVRDTSGLAQELGGLGQFDLGAASQVLLFTFLTTLSGASTLIQARREGVVRRIMASPVTSVQTMVGLGLGRLTVALFQGGYIVLASRLLFGVEWGDLTAVFGLLLVFGLVAAGLSMVIGVVADNEGLATGLAVGGGLVLAALGGCMMPLELFPDSLRPFAFVTPHAWGYEAFAQIQRHGGTLLDILPQLGVLAGMAVLALALGSVLLRRSLARAL